ncbi:MAG: hypothetical protein R6U84_04065 [Candidatus Cloacimonadales bacterium]
MFYGTHMGYSGFAFWGGLLFLALVVLVVYLILKKTNERPESKPSAMEILAEKFARGEISREEFMSKGNLINDVAHNKVNKSQQDEESDAK